MDQSTGSKPLHRMVELPQGKSIGDINDVYSGVKTHFHIGSPNTVCASCRKPFNAARKPRRQVLIYPAQTRVPVIVSLRICGHCLRLTQLGGAHKESVLCAVEAFFEGDEALQ